MIKSGGFFDYCIPEKCVVNENYEKTVRKMYDLGYRTIAISQVVSEESVEPKKRKKKGEAREPIDVVPVPLERRVLEGTEDMKILNRLTVQFSNQEFLHKITKSPNFKKYHIIAALPTTVPAFMYTCNNFDADIFSFDPESKSPIKLKRKFYNQLLDRGYHFELLYGPAIEDTTKRTNTIHMAHLYHSFGRSRGVIISSGASSPIHLRGPYDVVNLGLILGLSEQQAKSSVSDRGRSVYVKSVARRLGKVTMFASNADRGASVEIEESGECRGEHEDMETDQPAVKKLKH